MSELHDALPKPFLTVMQDLLGGEYNAFIESYRDTTRRGLRFNLLKAPGRQSRQGLISALSSSHNCHSYDSHQTPPGSDNTVLDSLYPPLTPVPWCSEGYQYPANHRPAKSILYNAGLFYIQEPSAMCPAAILAPKPGQRVLDLCAAPGGKSVQLAGYMQGQGLLVANDASPSRSRALVKNLEMSGVTNAMVFTEMPHRIAARFEGFFDCILVDAPCSGEGMFRRDFDAAKAYTANKPEACAVMQREILHHAARMLRPGGRMVYSTCTFNPLENEGSVSAFLAAHPDFELLPIDHEGLGLSRGRGDGCGKAAELFNLNNTARIWPHLAPGEGHFIALMARKGGESSVAKDTSSPEYAAGVEPACNSQSGYNTDISPTIGTAAFPDFKKGRKLPEEFLTFCREALHVPVSPREASMGAAADTAINKGASYTTASIPCTTDSIFVWDNHSRDEKYPVQRLYLQPASLDIKGLRVARSGWLLGEFSKGYFTPSQALAMGITKAQARYSVDLSEAEAWRYLKGESISLPEDFASTAGKPWVLICYMGYPLGWARLVQGRLKNQLPSGWVVT